MVWVMDLSIAICYPSYMDSLTQIVVSACMELNEKHQLKLRRGSQF